MSELLLQVAGLSKSYLSGDKRIQVLSDVAFDVRGGDTVSIRGESGSGKSTLLNLLAGLDAPDGGRIVWQGSEKLERSRMAALLGIVFQSFYLMPELSAFENVLMARRVVGRVTAEDRTRALSLLQRVGLQDRAEHVPAKLSGGERQRVAVARALMNSPRLILADEPTGNLDERTGDSVIDLLVSLCHETGTALVLVTHNAGHAAKAARRLFLHDGRLAPASPEAVTP